jgi:hypothetical protein
VKPPQKHQRFFFTERQLAILDSPAPHWSVPDAVWQEYMDTYHNLMEDMTVAVVRVDPPELLFTWRNTAEFHDVQRNARRLEDWFIWDLRHLGIPLLGWPSDERTPDYFYYIRYVDNDKETPEVAAWIERDLRRAGAEEPSDWLAEVLPPPVTPVC